jgi:hypothetical protein
MPCKKGDEERASARCQLLLSVLWKLVNVRFSVVVLCHRHILLTDGLSNRSSSITQKQRGVAFFKSECAFKMFWTG